jgi:hypothetical protein
MNDPKASRPHIPGYGLADADAGKGLLPWSWAVERLTRTHNYWIATTRRDGAPHMMPVWAVWFEGALWFSTGDSTVKARNLAVDARCTVSTEGAEEAVVLEGIAEATSDVARLRPMVDIYNAKYHWDMDPAQGGFYRVRPGVVFGFIEHNGEFQATATRWAFE